MSAISDAMDDVDAATVDLADAVAALAVLEALEVVDASQLLACENARRAVTAAEADLASLTAISLALQSA